MDLGFCLYCSSCVNSPPINLVNNKLANALPGVPIKSNGASTAIFSISSYSLFSAPTLSLVLTQNNQVNRDTNKNLQKATKRLLDSFLEV